MTRELPTSPPISDSAQLPKRDYFILPALSLLTILVMLAACELLARMIWVEDDIEPCRVHDMMKGDRFKANCSFRSKNAEGVWTAYDFNECGYRSATSCAPKPPGSVRIVAIGSSTSEAKYVAYQDTFIFRAASDLSRACGRTVDVQNLGVPSLSPTFTSLRIQEALALQPEVVVYPLAPYDVEHETTLEDLAALPQTGNGVAPRSSPLQRLDEILVQSRSVLAAQHFLFQNKETYLQIFMKYGETDYLRRPFTPAWRKHFFDLDSALGDMSTQMHAAGVPFVIIPIPSRAEAALLSSSQLPPNVNPYAFGREVESLATKHDVAFVDLMGPFSQIPHAETLYYVVNGHPAAGAEAVIGQYLAQKLQDGSVPAFSHCAAGQSTKQEH
jgi:hypothetical protein